MPGSAKAHDKSSLHSIKKQKAVRTAMEQSGQLSYFLFTFLPWDAPLGRRRLRGCSLWHRRFFRFCPGSDLESAHQKRQQGGEKPSPSRLCRATSPERERLWQGRKVYRLTVDFFLPLTGEDETCPLCQGLHLSGKTSPVRGKMSPPGDKKGNSCRRRRLRGFVLKATLSAKFTLSEAFSVRGTRRGHADRQRAALRS